MNWLLTAVLCIALVEIVVRLPFATIIGELANGSLRALRVVRSSRISDHWKEKAMGAYARQTFAASMKLAGLLAAVLAVAWLLEYTFNRLLHPGFEAFLFSWTGLLACLIAATAYLSLRKRFVTGPATQADTGYGPLDRVLHRAALQVSPVAELSFDLDQAVARVDREAVARGRHVFVAGLARAGTTILMRRFYATGQFVSLTYRDMPFVLAPGLWRRLTNLSRRSVQATERAHGDRIVVDADSPESLDEVFWRVFDGSNYINATRLRPHQPDADMQDRFVRYVGAILKADGQAQGRYLSKNNNNILRLHALRQAFPNALLLIPFREPVAHAASLRRQHTNFADQQGEDSFVRDYMGWLAHHEFGLDHRPVHFPGDDEFSPDARPDSSAYWLKIWLRTYRWLDRNAPESAVFVCYEDLCADPAVWQHLAHLAGVDDTLADSEAFVAGKADASAVSDPQLLGACQTVYQRLRARATLPMDEPQTAVAGD